MNYEPFDALYWSTQPDAERRARPSYRASFEKTLIGLNRAPVFLHKPLKQFDSWAVRNDPPASLDSTYSALAPQRTICLAGEQFRTGQTHLTSSKVL